MSLQINGDFGSSFYPRFVSSVSDSLLSTRKPQHFCLQLHYLPALATLGPLGVRWLALSYLRGSRSTGRESLWGVWLPIPGASSHLLLQPTSSVSSVSVTFKDVNKQHFRLRDSGSRRPRATSYFLFGEEKNETKVSHQEKTGFWDAKKRNESHRKKKIREAGLMLLPQSASRGQCFCLRFLWLTQRCTRELKHEAETSMVAGAS